MFNWTHKRLAILAGAYMALAAVTCSLPAWSQKAGVGGAPVSAPTASAAPLSPTAPNANASWNLTDILWGISRLQNSPQKLSAAQVQVVRPAVNKVIKGTQVVKGFESKVKAVLTADQLAYVEHLALSGELAKIPDNLPQSQPGQDPLVQYVVSALEKKAGR